MSIRQTIANAKDKVVGLFRKPETHAYWIELAFDDSISLDDAMAVMDQMEMDDAGFGINPCEEWEKEIPAIRPIEFWRNF